MSKIKRTVRPKLEIGAKEFQVLRQHAEAGNTFQSACNALGYHPNVVKRACADACLTSWTQANFPSRRGKSGGNPQFKPEHERKPEGIRKLRPDDIDAPLPVPDNPQTRWLTRRWAA
jgi:hypothetical protein